MTLTLIVNADDYGITAATNRGIERAHLAGVVTSTTVMANQTAVADAVELRRCCPELGVGIHLTLTLGCPLAPTGTVRSLVDADGRLLSRESLLGRLRSGGRRPEPDRDGVRSSGASPSCRRYRAGPLGCSPALARVPRARRADCRGDARGGCRCARNPQRFRMTRDRLRPRAIIQAAATHSDGRSHPAKLHDTRPAARCLAAPMGSADSAPSEWSDRGDLPPRRARRCTPRVHDRVGRTGCRADRPLS